MPYELKYIPLSNKLYDELVNELRKSFPNACVLYIKQVVNPELQTKYEKFVRENKVTEHRLFHGTKASVLGSICESGYKKEYNVVSAYGIGTYFSGAGDVSKQYTDTTDEGESFLFVNRVAVGADTGGVHPSIYAVRHDDAAYPEYLISFHKMAQMSVKELDDDTALRALSLPLTRRRKTRRTVDMTAVGHNNV
jgi:hypothetical protein